MNKILLYVGLIGSIVCNSCSPKLALVADKTSEQIATAYKVTKDISYGADKEQAMDII
jgi:hypothetical protein